MLYGAAQSTLAWPWMRVSQDRQSRIRGAADPSDFSARQPQEPADGLRFAVIAAAPRGGTPSRQVAAASAEDDAGRAAEPLAATALGDPWEQAITDSLSVLLRYDVGQGHDAGSAALMNNCSTRLDQASRHSSVANSPKAVDRMPESCPKTTPPMSQRAWTTSEAITTCSLAARSN